MQIKVEKPTLLARWWIFRRSWNVKALYKRKLILDYVDTKLTLGKGQNQVLSSGERARQA
jgi:hypothetical protein